MTDPRSRPALDALRAQIAQIETGGRMRRGVLPFGIDVIDAALPRRRTMLRE